MNYYAPTALDDALDLLAPQTLDVVAGGTDFFPALPAGGVKHSLLDVTRIDGLRGVSQSAGGVRIGAATRWSDIVQADLPACLDGLKHAARQVGSLQIQNAGTIAGNICNASPAADGVPP
ncbi:MAG: CO/xanthine dehydrogenase FAD-binding subunit, partial [Paracoccaceae bacterium]